jgi:hypothetical protein
MIEADAPAVEQRDSRLARHSNRARLGSPSGPFSAKLAVGLTARSASIDRKSNIQRGHDQLSVDRMENDTMIVSAVSIDESSRSLIGTLIYTIRSTGV